MLRHGGNVSPRSPSAEVTACLRRLSDGDESDVEELFDLVYADLRNMASCLFKHRTPNTLQPTELVHDAYLRLVRKDTMNFESRKHFFDVAGMAMRQLLTDHVRARLADKRGGGKGRRSREAPAH